MKLVNTMGKGESRAQINVEQKAQEQTRAPLGGRLTHLANLPLPPLSSPRICEFLGD